MMEPEPLAEMLRNTRDYLDRVIEPLAESDSSFTPQEGLFSVAQQVAHAAATVDWFMDGAFIRSDGFDLDFDAQERNVREVTSLGLAKRQWADAIDRAIRIVMQQAPSELDTPMVDGPIMAGLPRGRVVGGIADHSAHHRGALSLYARLLGKKPGCPYLA